jgi:hypothetical protein
MPRFTVLAVAGVTAALLITAALGRFPGCRQSEPAPVARRRVAYLEEAKRRGLVVRYERHGEFSGKLWVGPKWADFDGKEAVCVHVLQELFPDAKDLGDCRLTVIAPDGEVLGHFRPRSYFHPDRRRPAE